MATPYTIQDIRDLFDYNIANRFPAASEDAPQFNPPATDADFADLEHTIGRPLPLDFKQLYGLYNGESDYATSYFFYQQEWLSIKRIKDEWCCWNNLYKNGDLDENKIEDGIDPRIRPVWFDPAWIPISYDGAGNHYMLDLNPGPAGTMGQVITFYHDDSTRSVIAPSLLACMGRCLNQIKNKQLVYTADGMWEEDDEDGEGESYDVGEFGAEGETTPLDDWELIDIDEGKEEEDTLN